MNDPIILLFVTELILICFILFFTNGNLLSPSLVSIAMLSVATISVIYNHDFWDVSYSMSTYGVVLAGMMAMIIPELYICFFVKVFSDNNKRNLVERTAVFKEISPQRGLNFFFQFCALFFLIVLVEEVIVKGNFGSLGLYAIGVVKNDEANYSVLFRIARDYLTVLNIVYCYILLNNTVRCKSGFRKNVRYTLPVVFYLISMIFTGNRAAIIKFAGIVYVMYMVMQIDTSKRKKIKLFKTIRNVMLVGIVIVLVFYTLRDITKVNSYAAQRNFVDYITYYIGSPIYLFDKYLSSMNFVSNEGLFGHLTFTSLWQLFGYEPNYQNSFIAVGGMSGFAGNEFSWFQRPYSDFGFLGMLIFTSIVYSIYDYILYFKILYKCRGIKREQYLIVYAYLFYIPIMSFYYCQVSFAFSAFNFICIILSLIFLDMLIKKKIKIKI